MGRAIVALMLAALVTGCGVSKQVVADKDAALDACRGDLQAQQDAFDSETSRLRADLDACGNNLDACSGARSKLEADLETGNRQIDRYRKEAEMAKREADALKEREANLRSRLQKEIDDKTVEIENLRGKLSVRMLDQILFPSGSADILPEGKVVLDKVASVIADTTDSIRVEGHTDNVPIGETLKKKYPSNWELSGARASSVVRYFQAGRGIDPTRMEAVGLSAYNPVAPNDTPENLQRNRRVEVILSAAK